MSFDIPPTPGDLDLETPISGKEKICKVCGDKALGFNFNAITCESCKAFFRRNALKNKEFKCPFNKNCEITPVTRRFCQLCRLIKCFKIGMKKEYIMSEDDKREKWKKIEKNRANKKKLVEEEDASDGGANLIADQKRKVRRVDNDDESSYDDDEGSGRSSVGEENESKNFRNLKPVNLNSTNVPSSSSSSSFSSKKRQISYNKNREQCMPFPSPGLPESCSPETAAVTESRTCNFFEEMSNSSPTNQSRSVEIYQVSKSKIERDFLEENNELGKSYTDSNIIKIILDSEFSKPSEVYTNSTVSKQMESEKEEDEKKFCNFKEKAPADDNIIGNIFDLIKNGSNILLEYTKDGKNYLVISKDALTKYQEEGKSRRNRSQRLSDESVLLPGTGEAGYRTSTPLLNSLVDGRTSDSHVRATKKIINAETVLDTSRTSSLCETSSIDSILSEAIKLEYEAYTSMNPRNNGRELNDAERAKLSELTTANKALLAPLEDDLSGDDYGFNAVFGCGPSVLVDVLNLTAVAIRRLIKMSKKINAFKNMCQDDQIALLKGGCTEMMILRSAMTYDPDRDSWKIPQSKEKLMNIKVDILKEAGGRVFEEHQRFLQTFDPKWRNDENIMIILSAIALFTPDRPRVVHYDVIKLEQNSYYYLLRRYLESIYQGCEARLTFLKLIHKISELHKLNEDHVRVYLDANPREIEPLLIEIFDLKPH